MRKTALRARAIAAHRRRGRVVVVACRCGATEPRRGDHAVQATNRPPRGWSGSVLGSSVMIRTPMERSAISVTRFEDGTLAPLRCASRWHSVCQTPHCSSSRYRIPTRARRSRRRRTEIIDKAPGISVFPFRRRASSGSSSVRPGAPWRVVRGNWVDRTGIAHSGTRQCEMPHRAKRTTDVLIMGQNRRATGVRLGSIGGLSAIRQRRKGPTGCQQVGRAYATERRPGAHVGPSLTDTATCGSGAEAVAA